MKLTKDKRRCIERLVTKLLADHEAYYQQWRESRWDS